MEIVYGKRSLVKIKARSMVYWFYDRLRRGMGKIKRIKRSGVVNKILLYPVLKHESDLSDILNRVLWGFPFKERLEITVLLEDEDGINSITAIETPKYQRRYLEGNRNHISFKKKNEPFSSYDKILIWNKFSALSPNLSPHFEKVEIADKNFYSNSEGNVWKKGYFTAFSESEKEQFRNISRTNYESLIKKTAGRSKGYCFLTGPTFDEYKKFRYEKDSIKVICNTIVINDEFLEYIGGPDIIAFADPVFHFSSCEYAAVFRDHVLKVFKKYQCYIVVPEETVPLLLAHYPELREYLIGIGLSMNITISSPDNLFAKGAASIVTYLMTPVLSGLCNEIYYLGADGREKSENYFWKHNKNVQLSDKMESVFQSHPSFFRDRIYEDSYNEYCEYFEALLTYGEKSGKKYYSLTRSFIPALAKRKNPI